MKKHTKQSAGQIGGRATVRNHSDKNQAGKNAHMSDIGRRGAKETWSRYHLSPVGLSGWAMVDRQTNEVKTFINYMPGR